MMKMRKTLACAAVLIAAFAAGCSRSDQEAGGSERSPRPKPVITTTTTTTYGEYEEEYEQDDTLAALYDSVPSLDVGDDEEVMELLSIVCDAVNNSDGDFYEVGTVLVEASDGTFNLNYSDAGSVVAAAIALQCPEWADEALEWANS